MQCKNCQKSYDINFRESDFYRRANLPPSPQCLDCRLLWLLQWRNERTLYSDQCGLCGRAIVSKYNPAKGYVNYCHPCFNSDKWDSFSYGREFDFNRTFAENFNELLKAAPKPPGQITKYESVINSNYTNYVGDLKNCYLIFNTSYAEDTYYSRGLHTVKDLVDGYFAHNLEIGYEVINVNDSYSLFFCQDCNSCRDCWFCQGCQSCSDCFGCVNLVHQKYCWFNQQLSVEEYQQKIAEAQTGSYQQVLVYQKQAAEQAVKFPRRENTNRNTITSLGDYLNRCKGCYRCFEAQGAEDCLDCFSVKRGRDCFLCFGFTLDSELLYCDVACGYDHNVCFSVEVDYSQNVYYSHTIKKAKNCFGCASLPLGGEFCILNKKYSENEYKILREKIIAHMQKTGEYGLYFPPQICTFSHNETMAQEFFPLTREAALAQGLKWENKMPGVFGQETIKAEDLPDHITEVKDEITKEILACGVCGKNYKIIPQELAFYRKYNLSLPRRCFNCRHLDRVRRRGPWRPIERLCAKCQKNILAYVAADYPGPVYCEDCYRQEIY